MLSAVKSCPIACWASFILLYITCINDFPSLIFTILSCFQKYLPLWSCRQQSIVSHLILFNIVFCSYSLKMHSIMMNIIQITLYMWVKDFHSLTFANVLCFKKNAFVTMHTAFSCQTFDTVKHEKLLHVNFAIVRHLSTLLHFDFTHFSCTILFKNAYLLHYIFINHWP